MEKNARNYAFIDAQNLNLGIQELGWKLDYRKFRRYLREKYAVEVAYMFLGFVTSNQRLYSALQKAGFVLNFKPVVLDGQGKFKGNADADLVLQVMIDLEEFDQAVLVTSDGDFYSLVRHLYELDKLKVVLSPSVKHCSSLLRKEAKEKIVYMSNLRKKLEYAPNK
jgi:uncharacterized LabA/DUF88 family protein